MLRRRGEQRRVRTQHRLDGSGRVVDAAGGLEVGVVDARTEGSRWATVVQPPTQWWHQLVRVALAQLSGARVSVSRGVEPHGLLGGVERERRGRHRHCNPDRAHCRRTRRRRYRVPARASCQSGRRACGSARLSVRRGVVGPRAVLVGEHRACVRCGRRRARSPRRGHRQRRTRTRTRTRRCALPPRPAASGRSTSERRFPAGAGSGSPGAARVAGPARGGPARRRRREARPSVLREATELEGHADNVAASLYGGVVAVAGGHVVRVPLARVPAVVVWIPGMRETGRRPRRRLPELVPFADARCSTSDAACSSSPRSRPALEALRTATEDRLHQDRRLARVPDSRAAMEAALTAGAWGAWLSGSGPRWRPSPIRNERPRSRDCPRRPRRRPSDRR